MEIYISGIHSGPDPSAGVGVARCLRHAYPKARLIGVDYSIASTGIHFDAFDDVWVQRPWNELDMDIYREQIARVLQGGDVWIPCLDLEIRWLSKAMPEEPGILAPQRTCLDLITKPAIAAARGLPVSVPQFVLADRSHWELHAFCRRHGWPIWCKGPNHEARLVWSWAEAMKAMVDLQAKWVSAPPALQSNVTGNEESIAFCAYKGKLLDCVHMQKRSQTFEGKTWGGAVHPVEAPFRKSLERILEQLDWTGGGELEFVRDDEDALHLFDWNPRFPAWIYGATIAGHNLPARLAQAAGAGTPQKAHAMSGEFARVVMEFPVRAGYGLPEPAAPGFNRIASGKHPSGMTLLAKRLAGERRPQSPSPEVKVPRSIMEDLLDMGLAKLATPRLVFLPRTAQQTFQRARALQEISPELGLAVHVGYSVKTNPHETLMRQARQAGLMAEVINGLELKHALACGFTPDQIILNGPAQTWRQEPVAGQLYAVFADSLERLRSFMEPGGGSRYVGARLRPVTLESRFGVDLSDPGEFSTLLDILRRFDGQSLGMHFHFQSDVIGTKPWRQMFEAMAYAAQAIGERSGKPVRCLDLGGGWFPEDLADELVPNVRRMLKQASEMIPTLESIVIEPGKALAQPSMALVTRVLEVRRPGSCEGSIEVIVDSSVADLPQANLYPHRIMAFLRDGTSGPLPDGDDRVLGRNCMEFDYLATAVRLPSHLRAGDTLVFCDAGGYDASMSYDFAGGRIRNV